MYISSSRHPNTNPCVKYHDQHCDRASRITPNTVVTNVYQHSFSSHVAVCGLVSRTFVAQHRNPDFAIFDQLCRNVPSTNSTNSRRTCLWLCKSFPNSTRTGQMRWLPCVSIILTFAWYRSSTSANATERSSTGNTSLIRAQSFIDTGTSLEHIDVS